MREMTLRVRGEKEVSKILRMKKSAVGSTLAQLTNDEDEDADANEDELDAGEEDDDAMADHDRTSDDDAVSVTSNDSQISRPSGNRPIYKADSTVERLAIVIEDSECEEIDLLDA